MTNQVAKMEPEASREVAAHGGHAVTPMEMLQTAIERGTDMDQLTKLMDLQERWEANEARKAFVAALNAFKADPPKITKNKHVSYASKGGRTEYDHATLDQVSEVIGKALAKHGLSHRWETDQISGDVTGGRIKVTCVLTHEMGHSERVSLHSEADASGGKNSIQAIGSAVTYLQRYTLLAVTGLAAADQDDDGRGVNPLNMISAEQKQELVDLIRETGTDTGRFCQYLRVSSLDDLPAERFNHAKQALQKKAEKKADKKEAAE